MHASLIKVPCVFYYLEKDAHVMTKAFPFMYKCCGKEILIVVAVAFLRDLVK